MQTSFDRHSLIFWVALAVVTVVLTMWVMMVHARNRRLEQRLQDLFAGASADNVAQMLVEYLGSVRATAAAVERIQHQHEQLADIVPTMMRHVGLVRFSPFHDTGGDQSFTLAMLDGQQNGVVITGLHSRTDSRLYAKPIQSGESEYTLIPEEREAITQALSDVRGQVASG